MTAGSQTGDLFADLPGSAPPATALDVGQAHLAAVPPTIVAQPSFDAPPARDLLSGESARWFTIAAHRPFLDDLARGLWDALTPEGPEALADAVVLLPTRRAARDLAQAFVGAAGGKAVLLPQIRTIGDLDEGEPPFEPGEAALAIPPAVSPLRRRFELARLVAEHAHLLKRTLDARAALQLADALAGLLDGLQLEEAGSEDRIDALVQGELARHWQVSADFLRVATRAWPARLDALGLMDVGARQIALLRALAAQWRDRPPRHPLVAAGSTGGAPALADLLTAVAAAPRGAVVLPGLDRRLADDAWAEVDAGHPQGALKALLARAGVARDAVRSWPAHEEAAARRRGEARERVLNEALRPAAATADWLGVIARLAGPDGGDPVAEGLEGLAVLPARTEEAAAAQAAVLLREALETPGRTAALVTPDPALARRTAARLARWGIAVDSSAGAPLADLPAGVLLALVARAAADPLDPATLLALAKHPLARLGQPGASVDLARRRLERYGLRGPRPRSWGDLFDRLEAKPETTAEAQGLARTLQAAIDHAAAPFASGAAEAPAAMRALAEAAEMAAADDAGRLGDLWGGPGGEAAASLVAGVLQDGAGLPPVTRAAWAQAVGELLAGEVMRAGGALHPRLRILGLIEARLVRADLTVLAGLEEGVWPAAAASDPFLSRPMRAELGLPPPERRVGLSAHDFVQGACAPEVVLIHSERRGGQPAVRSRWLWRLETLARGARGGEAAAVLPTRAEVARWAERLDAPVRPAPASLKPAERPKPRPPVAARPRNMAVTRVEEWVRDPYAIYARRVLRLRALDRPDAPVEALARGSAVHAAFERFAEDALHPGAEDRFAALLAEALHAAGLPSWRMAREQALAANLARWVVDFERGRREGAELHVERTGALILEAPGGPFTVTAKADRLERRAHATDVLDFKTGAPHSEKQVRSGFAPQLPLTAAILHGGGFTDIGAADPGELLYVRVTGRRRDPGAAEPRTAEDGTTLTLAQSALEGLARRVARFDDPDTPYASWAAPQFLGKYRSDYDHLARVWEWHVMGAEGDADAEAGE